MSITIAVLEPVASAPGAEGQRLHQRRPAVAREVHGKRNWNDEHGTERDRMLCRAQLAQATEARDDIAALELEEGDDRVHVVEDVETASVLDQ